MAEARHFLSPDDLTLAEVAQVVTRAKALKALTTPPRASALRVGSLFFNPSLRTRVSWEQAAWVLGASCQTLNAGGETWKLEFDPQAVMDQDTVEHVKEAAPVLGRYFHVLGIRSFPATRPWAVEREEPELRAFAQYAGVPIVSLEGAMHHPCQALADQLTLEETFGANLHGLPVVLTWAWHPKPLPMAVPNSFALQMARAGAKLTLAYPEGYDLDPELRAKLGGDVQVCHDPHEAMRGAKAVYVKSWGRLDLWDHPAEEVAQRADLRHWQFDMPKWELTDDAAVLHCLPTRRNAELSGEILDGPMSKVIDEAENRLWAQAALLEFYGKALGVLA